MRRDLEVLAQISRHAGSSQLINELLQRFKEDRRLLQNRGSLIVRKLCELLRPEGLPRVCADPGGGDRRGVWQHDDPDAQPHRPHCQGPSGAAPLLTTLTSPSGGELFTALYKSWCHNPVATFSSACTRRRIARGSAHPQIRRHGGDSPVPRAD